jgi:hypothetical protein
MYLGLRPVGRLAKGRAGGLGARTESLGLLNLPGFVLPNSLIFIGAAE